MYAKLKKHTYPTQLEEFKMPIIKLTIEEHQSLTQLLCHPKTVKYRSDLYDTDTFDSMEDKIFDGVNNLTIEDF